MLAAAGLVFGEQTQEAPGWIACPAGTGIHFLFTMAWGVLFAWLWPYFRKRGCEATFLALIYAVIAWIVMHAALMMAADNHPDYFDQAMAIGGFMSHFFFTIPLALDVKHRRG